jgi:hypothetical protein
MSISAGGRAGKLGNRYEGLWVAYNLLRLLWEEVRTVQLEAIGDDERGVDLWVTGLLGQRQAYQCKRKNGIIGRWSVADLASEDVLTNAATQLRRDRSSTFTFVSADPAPTLRELADTARGAGGDAGEYFRLTLAVDAHADNLRRFCVAVGVSERDPTGQRDVFDLLTRIHTHTFEDSTEGRAQIALHARCLITGDSRTAVELLANFAQDHMGTALTVDQVRDHLREREFGLVHLVGDTRVAEQVEKLRQHFRESLQPSLIQSSLVPRPEAVAAFEYLAGPTAGGLVVVHGRAGSGKSCVLLQLINLLELAQVPYLPLRLDRRAPRTSSRQYGIDGCGLPESPAVVLHALHPGRRVVLVVDQLDAIRWTAAHASAPWEACQEVIDDALRLPNVAVVVACRSFDLRDDQQISAWHARRRGREIEVGELSREAVAAVVVAAGAEYAGLTPRQQDLLRSPLHLALWVQVRGANSDLHAWNTQADLLRAFWESRFELATRLGVPPLEFRGAVAALVTDLDRRGELAGPARLLDPYPQASTALKSLNVVVEADRQVTFAHQSYFEYQLATHLLDQVRDQGGAIADWVRRGDQSLLRREQLRLVLTLLRDEDSARYLGTIRALLVAPAGQVRFHLRQLALRVLGEGPEPTGPECDLVYELARNPAWREHVFDLIFIRQAAWFGAMDDRGLLREWLSSLDEMLINSALRLCLWLSPHCGDRVARLMVPLLNEAEPWPTRVASTLHFNPATDSDELFRLRLQLIRRGVNQNRHLMAKELVEWYPSRLIELLEAHIDRRGGTPIDPDNPSRWERNFPFSIPHHEAEHAQRVAETIPEQFWSRLAPHIACLCEASCEEEGQRCPWPPFFRDQIWEPHYRQYSHDGSVELPEIVARAGSRVATQNPKAFATEYTALIDHPGLSVQYMIGLALIDADEPAADLAINWLCANTGRFAIADDHGESWGIAKRIIQKHAGRCSPAIYARLEETILGFHEPEERRSVEWQLRRDRESREIAPNQWGLAQHALLPCLPDGRLSDTARSEMGVLGRKFQRPASAYTSNNWFRWGQVVGPIRSDRAARLSDRTWLEIIGSVTGTDHRRRYEDDYLVDPSAEGYAQILGERVRLEPQRFATLAERVPVEAEPVYWVAILHALQATTPPNTECTNWSPALDTQLTAVIARIGYREDQRIGNALCWLMYQRPRAIETNECLEILTRYVTDHPHPGPNWRSSPRNESDHEVEALNCVRGVAVGAVGRVLFAQPCLLPALLPPCTVQPSITTLQCVLRWRRLVCRC